MLAHAYSLRRDDPAWFQAGHGARAAHRHNGYRSRPGTALISAVRVGESGFSCGAVSQEWEGGAGGVQHVVKALTRIHSRLVRQPQRKCGHRIVKTGKPRDRLLRNARSTEIVCADDAGGRAHSDHDFMAS